MLMVSVAESRYVHAVLGRFFPDYNQIDFHQKYQTPFISIIIITVIAMFFILFLQKTGATAMYGDIISLSLFTVVNILAIILRYKMPNAERKYKMPFNIGNFPIISLM